MTIRSEVLDTTVLNYMKNNNIPMPLEQSPDYRYEDIELEFHTESRWSTLHEWFKSEYPDEFNNIINGDKKWKQCIE